MGFFAPAVRVSVIVIEAAGGKVVLSRLTPRIVFDPLLHEVT
jgi:hypothetical protein